MKRRLVGNLVVATLVGLMAIQAVPRASFAAGVPIDTATPEQKKVAQGRYELGAKAFAANKFDIALTEFTASYDTVASPNAHFMMARTLNELGETVRAYNELSVVEREAKVSEKYAATLEQSAALRTDLAKKLSIVVVDVSGAAGGKLSATLGGKEVPLGEQIAVAPGPVEVVILADGKVVDRSSASLTPGEVHPFKFNLSKPAPVTPPPVIPEQPKPSSGGRTGYWVGAGVFGAVAVAGFVMGGVEGAAAKSQYDSLKKSCTNGTGKLNCPPGEPKIQSSIQQKGTIANVGWALGGVGAAGAATMLIIGLTRKGSSDARTGAVPVTLTIGAGSVGVDGRF